MTSRSKISRGPAWSTFGQLRTGSATIALKKCRPSSTASLTNCPATPEPASELSAVRFWVRACLLGRIHWRSCTKLPPIWLVQPLRNRRSRSSPGKSRRPPKGVHTPSANRYKPCRPNEIHTPPARSSAIACRYRIWSIISRGTLMGTKLPWTRCQRPLFPPNQTVLSVR